jgi:hypothetical protein
MEDRQFHMAIILRTSGNIMNWQKDAKNGKRILLMMRDFGGPRLYMLMLKKQVYHHIRDN